MTTTAEIAARTHRPRKTVRTSFMWARSRSLRTGWPFTSTAKSPPNTRSDRIASVAALSSDVE